MKQKKMHYKKVVCLWGVLALTGCAYPVITDEFADPRFYLTLKPYSKNSTTVTLCPDAIKDHQNGSFLKEKCVLSENKIGRVTFECDGVDGKELISYEIKETPNHNPYQPAYPNVMVGVTTYEKYPDGKWHQLSYHSHYIPDETLKSLKDHQNKCMIKK